MLNDTKWLITTAGKAAVLTVLLGSTTLAQGSTDNEAIVPEAAKTSEPNAGAVRDSEFPIPEQLDNNDAVIDTLISQGFTDIHILRKAAIMTVTAMRDGQPVELVYNVSNGTLVSVDGQELNPTTVDESGSGSLGTSTADATDPAEPGEDVDDDGTPDDDSPDDGTPDDGASDDGTGDDGSSDDGASDDGSADTGGDDGTNDDGSSDDGSDSGDSSDGSDSDSGDGSDSGNGSDSGDGSDSGGGSGSDGGSDSGDSSGGA
ncbi:hypothetical protein [Paracoccus onubensis]|uniref:Uncharacterized protein n=1 Tax=Paracoccus onubensis TaxID=1675788 RepID=A0A418SV35_9RHOB|nr:hypothetical protein [Paracoccus onubensis]RJE84826.1 hypothetical protein D3P04_10930 [Paracoccus onubensis]